MNQQTFLSQAGFEKHRRKSRREMFLDEMELVPWAELQTIIEPHYAKAGNGQRPVGSFDHAADLFFCSSDSIYPTLAWRRRCTSLPHCGGLRSWTLAARQLRTRRRSADSAIFWKSMNEAVRC